MGKLIDHAKVLRSKNAGPLFITFDIMFDTVEQFEYVMPYINKKEISQLYDIDEMDIKIIPYKVVFSIKITIPRTNISGSILDQDIYGCQQHMKLANIIIP